MRRPPLWRRRSLQLTVVGAIAIVAGLVYVAALDPTDGRSTRSSPNPPSVPSPRPPRHPEPTPINTGVEGLTTFRGNATRTYYGRGPVPKDPVVLWQFPTIGGLCSESEDQEGVRLWCGTGWTGQPNVVETNGRIEIRFGAFDRAVHVLDGDSGEELMTPFFTGDLIKGTVTSDPDGYPLLYTGSRDNYFRILALDRGDEMVELYSLSSDTAPAPLWNNDWDGSALVVDDYLIVGGENSWFYVVKLNRAYDAEGLATVDPEIRMLVAGYDDELLAELGDSNVSIESSVALHDEVAYFANSGGLVQGWDIGAVLEGGRRHRRVFRYWTGEDTDSTVVVGDEDELYVSSELERFTARSTEAGQLMRLDPDNPSDPVVWSLAIPGSEATESIGGIWSTPALYKGALYATTNTGRLLAVDRNDGTIAWEIELPPHAWSSPIVVDGTLIVGDCNGVLHAYDVRRPLSGRPEELWSVQLDGCIESTPAVWEGRIYVGTKAGAVYAVGDA